MTPAAAGWTIDGHSPTPGPCPGSGQVAAPWAPPSPSCPSCGRRLARDLYTGTLPEHYPDADGAQPLNLWPEEIHPMTTTRCAHCGVLPADDDAVPGLCQPCADLAVWGASCADCERIPTGRERVDDYALTIAGLTRSDPRAVELAR